MTNRGCDGQHGLMGGGARYATTRLMPLGSGETMTPVAMAELPVFTCQEL